MTWLALAWGFRKMIIIAVACAGAGWLVLGQIHAYGDRRAAAEHNAVMALWEADALARDAVNAAELARQAADREVQRKANDAILEDYNAKLLAAAGERDNYFRLLQRATGQVRGLTAAQATGALIAATAGEAGISERINRATAGLLIEHRANADQLDALIAVIEPQREPTP